MREVEPKWGTHEGAANSLKKGARGRLEFGGQLNTLRANGHSNKVIDEYLRQNGVSPPSNSSKSKWQEAYGAWVESAGIPMDEPVWHEDHMEHREPMTLTGVAVEKLYHLAPAVRAGADPAKLLAFAYNNSDAQVRQYAKDVKAGEDGDRDERDKPQVKHARYDANEERILKLPTNVFEDFHAVVDRVRANQGNPKITPLQVFEFMVGVLREDTTAEESLDYLWRSAHGELTPEEAEAAERIHVDVE